MKINKFLTMALALFLVLCLVPFSASAACEAGCVDADNNYICDVCGVCYNRTCRDYSGDGDHNCNNCGTRINECTDTSNNGNHNCTECGAENVSVCFDRYRGESDRYEDHLCEDCNATLPCYDLDNNHHCDGCKAVQPACAVPAADYCEVCGAVKITEANFPDANFRNYLLSVTYGSDGVLTALEIKDRTYLGVSNKSIMNLKGIEFFTALKELDAGSNQLITVDLSKNTALTYVSIGYNLLTSLDLSNNTALTKLYCYDNQLTSLDLSKNTALEALHCYHNYFSTLDLSNNTALTYLECSNSQMTSLDLSKNTALKNIYVYGNQLTSLTLGNLPALKVLSANENQLTSLDVSGCPALQEVYCRDNLLKELTLGEKNQLTTLYCNSNQLTALDVTKAPTLKTFNCSNNRLTSLDLTKNTALNELYCEKNKLPSLDLTKNTSLTYIECDYNKLVSLDVGNNTMLKTLRAEHNKLTSIDLAPLTYLGNLDLDYNELTAIDVSKNQYLEYLCCNHNKLTSIDTSKNLALKDLELDYNDLTTLDVSKNVALTSLDAGYNHLTSLDISGNNKLSNVWMSSNTYYIELDDNFQFDLSTLPAGFSTVKASKWSDICSVTGYTLTLTTDHPEWYTQLSYTYDIGNGKTASFCLQFGATTNRVYGENRFETATSVANQMRNKLGISKFDAIVLANGYNFADALSGSYLAAAKDAPILLTWNGKDKYNYLNEYTVDYVKKNLADGGTVYILGGTSAVPQLVDDLLAGYNVKRIAGENRFETNLLILKEAGVKPGDEVLVCTATGFADSLSASAVGKPILLVHKNLTDNQKAYLETLSGNSFCILGGENAVSNKLADQVGAYGSVSRLAGANRFETSVLVAQKYFTNPDSAVLAYAADFPDGLCGGPLAYTMDAPLILTMTKQVTQATEYIQAEDIREGVILGGDGLIASNAVNKIFN